MYDEPTAGLDPIASTVVEDLIRSVHINGRDAMGKPGTIASYLVVTHQHSTIRRAVDRILFLHGGKVVWEGTTADFDNSTNPIVRQVIHSLSIENQPTKEQVMGLWFSCPAAK
jgi:ABC-type transporter Mla maintaining outer membrane lipid asymmetry ATPase subunit MlaF